MTRPIEGVATAVAAFVGHCPSGPVGLPRLVTSMSNFDLVFGGLSPESHLGYSVRDFFRHGGSSAVVVRVDPSLPATETIVGGLRALGTRARLARRTADPLGLLVVPPTPAVGPAVTQAAGTTGPNEWLDLEPEAVDAVIACAERLGAVAILDPPADWTSAGTALSGIRDKGTHANAALYFPRVTATDPLTGAVRTFAPSGAVAGVIARNDARAGVWDAPAGVEAVLDIDGLSVELTPGDRDELNTAGVNILLGLPHATVVWGARTLGEREWKYVSVRRLALFIEHSVSRGLRWATFEPNDEPLWAQVRSAVEDFLLGLWRRGALPGSKPEEAFFVSCDRTTMTQDDLLHGRLVVQVGVATSRPAEFVILRIGAKAAPGQP